MEVIGIDKRARVIASEKERAKRRKIKRRPRDKEKSGQWRMKGSWAGVGVV
jgi:hypothetical protein